MLDGISIPTLEAGTDRDPTLQVRGPLKPENPPAMQLCLYFSPQSNTVDNGDSATDAYVAYLCRHSAILERPPHDLGKMVIYKNPAINIIFKGLRVHVCGDRSWHQGFKGPTIRPDFVEMDP